MSNEVVTVEKDGEILTLKVLTGTSDEEIKMFLSGGQQEESGGAVDSFAREVAEPINRGALGLLDLPVNLVNAGFAGLKYADKWIKENILGGEYTGGEAPQLPRPFTEAGERLGVIAPPEEQRHGLIPRTFEFVGGSIIPLGALMNYGGKALASLAPVPSALQTLGTAVASSPGKATAFDIISNFTAATGGVIAKEFTDNETIIAVAEFGAGFTPTAIALVPGLAGKLTLAGKAKDAVVETLLPFTESGGRVAAAKRLQEVAGDPELAASKIDPDAPLPPAVQTGDPGLIKLQNIIVNKFPHLKKQFSDELNLAIKQLKSGADFGGDADRARHLLNIRAQMAVEELAITVSKMSPDVTPRQMSVAVRKSIDAALVDAKLIEKSLWEGLDTTAPGNVDTARRAMNDEISVRSIDADPDDIPKWLLNKLRHNPIDPKLAKALKKQGIMSDDGIIDPAIRTSMERQGLIKERQRNLNDLTTIRSRVLRESRDERGQISPNRNKIRILDDIQAALLEDMSATGVQGVERARGFSSALNERFRQGRVGRLLGFDKTGAEKVSPEDLLDSVMHGSASASTTQRMIEMSSEAPEMTLQYIKARYIESVYDADVPNTAAHRTFVKNLRKSGMFEVFPELEATLNAANKQGLKAAELKVPDSHINTTRLNKDQSRAALYLQADPGSEMKAILKSNHPAGAAREILKVVKKDAAAVRGLKTSFAEEVFRLSGGNNLDIDGRIIPNGLKLKALLNDYESTMRALHMTDGEISRLNRIAENYRVAQIQGDKVDIGATILDKGLLPPIDLMARFVGARAGGRMGNSMGSGLVMANFMSSQGRQKIMSLTTSKAEKLLIQATTDPELYKALLVGPNRTDTVQKSAAAVIERAMLQSEIAGVRALALAGATGNDEGQ